MLESSEVLGKSLLADADALTGPVARTTYQRSESAKRGFDIVVSTLALVLVTPLALVISILVAATSRGPVIYWHPRVGVGGRIFGCFKFRTMMVGADTMLADDLHLSGEFGRSFKLPNDPRLTRLGKLLRKTSLDELPQLINVVRGEMSLVGPRPLLPEEVDRYGDRAEQVLSVLPGITGLWQVSGRNNLTYAQRIELQAACAANRSLTDDVRIIGRTVIQMFRPARNGAY